MNDVDGKGKVLLVDDEPSLLRAQARYLERHGFEVESCESGKLALERLASTAFDTVVTDLTMPDVSGLELLRQVREHDKDLPIILVTGSASLESAAEAIDHGVFKYLLKPVDLETLRDTVQRASQLYRLGRAKRETVAALGQHAGEASDRAGLEAGFERALGSLWVALQPILQVSDRGVFGYEALLRSSEASLPHPGAVIDAAERLGRLQELGRRIRELVLEAMVAAPSQWKFFINLHPRDLLDPQLYTVIERSGVSDRLVLEITERASLDDIPDAKQRIGSLRGMGCRIAVDDLGAGYAGLSSFVQLEPDIVKLDMSLVRDVDKSPLKQKLIASLTQVCRDMGLLIVAEGIETAEERDVVVSLHCDLVQGYRFGRPSAPFVVPSW